MTGHERDELIARITHEVLQRLGARAAQPDGPRVAVALSADASRVAIDVIRALVEHGCSVGAIACSSSLPEERRSEALAAARVSASQSGLPADVVALVAPEMSLTDVAKLTFGILDDTVPRIVWQAVASRLAVLASPGHALASDLPASLQRISANALALSKRLGIVWTPRDRLVDAVADRTDLNDNQPRVSPDAAGKRALVTEAAVGRLPDNASELVVPMDAIITPLARDLAKRSGIRIRRESSPDRGGVR
ncbi:hypothetical protein FJZ36_11050 [Candidatus Poribacteria bacterium]|nr:hypothetical protein [Candidatus Poribacteria bacterium]